MLSITSVSEKRRMVPESNMETLLVNLHDKQWARLSEISVSMDVLDLKDARITEIYGRPAEKLQVFVLRGPTHAWLPVDLYLLNGHAPELVRFSAPGYTYMNIDLKSPSMFTSNMRHLQLEDRQQVRVFDLLEGCMRMPLPETLELSITTLIHEGNAFRSSSLPRPTMSKLKVDIFCLTLDIYPAFIDRITPAVNCASRTTHYFDDSM